MVNEGCPYFYVELPDGTRMAALSVRNFPLQFGREVRAGCLVQINHFSTHKSSVGAIVVVVMAWISF